MPGLAVCGSEPRSFQTPVCSLCKTHACVVPAHSWLTAWKEDEDIVSRLGAEMNNDWRGGSYTGRHYATVHLPLGQTWHLISGEREHSPQLKP